MLLGVSEECRCRTWLLGTTRFFCRSDRASQLSVRFIAKHNLKSAKLNSHLGLIKQGHKRVSCKISNLFLFYLTCSLSSGLKIWLFEVFSFKFGIWYNHKIKCIGSCNFIENKSWDSFRITVTWILYLIWLLCITEPYRTQQNNSKIKDCPCLKWTFSF